jgi:predicted PurR-regulated permease PerM
MMMVLLATVIIIPVYIFMILYYQPLILNFIRELFAKEHHASVVEVITQIRGIVQSYLRGLMIEMIIVATLNSIALLAIGVEYAILLGIIGAILNLIPYLGGLIAISLPMIVALVNQDVLHMFLVMGAYILIQFVDNNYLIPKVVASRVQVNALVSIIGVLLAGALWGVPGMFLSIPLLAVMKIICDHIDSLKPYGKLMGDTMPLASVVESFLRKGKPKT